VKDVCRDRLRKKTLRVILFALFRGGLLAFCCLFVLCDLRDYQWRPSFTTRVVVVVLNGSGDLPFLSDFPCLGNIDWTSCYFFIYSLESRSREESPHGKR